MISMTSIRTLPPLAVFVLGLVLLFGAASLGRAFTPALAQAPQHSQSLDQKADNKSGSAETGQKTDHQKTGQKAGEKKGKTAGNGSSGTGRTEGILVAEVLLLLIVGRVLGEGM